MAGNSQNSFNSKLMPFIPQLKCFKHIMYSVLRGRGLIPTYPAVTSQAPASGAPGEEAARQGAEAGQGGGITTTTIIVIIIIIIVIFATAIVIVIITIIIIIVIVIDIFIITEAGWNQWKEKEKAPSLGR